MKMINTLFFLLVFTGTLVPSFGQIKYEKEVRLDKKDVPATARDFVRQFAFTKKVKWYKEIGLTSTSIEAKTKHKGQRYSIEFDNEGILEDVEIEIGAGNIKEGTINTISTYLSEELGKYEIEKIQIQYVGPPENILSFLKEQNHSELIITNYEFVINSKVDKAFRQFEYLFDESGVFIKSYEIILRNTDNIEY